MLLMSLSTKAAEIPKSYFQLKPGEQSQVEAWCFNAKKMSDLRKGVEQCEADRIDLRNQRDLNASLLNSKPPEKALWQEWWVKVPAGILIGSALGAAAGKESNSHTIGAVAAALTGTATVVLLDMDF